MTHMMYGVCINNIEVDHDKLIALMKETLPDFPSENASIYADYIAECKTKRNFVSPEGWIQNYVFAINEQEISGIGALLYKNLRINNPEKMILCTTSKNGNLYLGITLGEKWTRNNNMEYTSIMEIKQTLKKYIKKISNKEVEPEWITNVE